MRERAPPRPRWVTFLRQLAARARRRGGVTRAVGSEDKMPAAERCGPRYDQHAAGGVADRFDRGVADHQPGESVAPAPAHDDEVRLHALGLVHHFLVNIAAVDQARFASDTGSLGLSLDRFQVSLSRVELFLEQWLAYGLEFGAGGDHRDHVHSRAALLRHVDGFTHGPGAVL